MAQEAPPSTQGEKARQRAEAYWRANVRLIAILLTIWFVVSIVFGIILVEPLNAFRIGQLPLGFWISQQGSIYTFVLLILVYAVVMDKLEKALDREAANDER
jgi:putative solute:sodium symporter small subunit